MPLQSTHSPLFTPIRIGALDLPNRLVLAPMTRNRAVAGEVPNPLAVEYYAQRASAGLMITEATQVSADAQGYPRTPGVHSDEQVAAWRLVTDAVHARGGRIFVQLWHTGRISHVLNNAGGLQPVAPSAIAPSGKMITPQGMKDFETPRALELSEIPLYVAKFADAARRAIEAGFDGVELHGANGYLIDQFLRDSANQRTDAYGGSTENRARFLFEVTEAVVAAIGADRTAVRLSPRNPFNSMSDSTPEETFRVAAEGLNRLGLAYLHVLEALSGPMAAKEPRLTPTIRKAFTGPLMLNGGYTKELADQAITNGEGDLVAFGVPYLANPDLPERFAAGAELNKPDMKTFYQGEEKGYTDYALMESVVGSGS
jgi:N-ethylmaleimide reductase